LSQSAAENPAKFVTRANPKEVTVADVSYVPTFHHINWLDKLDRVEAEGPNGFNGRFNAIGADLRQLSTAVGQVGPAINDFRKPPPAQQQTMTFTPALQAVPPNVAWVLDDNGTAGAVLSFSGPGVGVANLTLPDHVRLTTLRVRGSLENDVRASVALSRTALSLTLSAPFVEQLASIDFARGSFDLQSPAVGSLALIEPSTFRYFISARVSADGGVSGSVTIEAIELAFVPA
jgi:hypothetical protein